MERARRIEVHERVHEARLQRGHCAMPQLSRQSRMFFFKGHKFLIVDQHNFEMFRLFAMFTAV